MPFLIAYLFRNSFQLIQISFGLIFSCFSIVHLLVLNGIWSDCGCFGHIKLESASLIVSCSLIAISFFAAIAFDQTNSLKTVFAIIAPFCFLAGFTFVGVGFKDAVAKQSLLLNLCQYRGKSVPFSLPGTANSATRKVCVLRADCKDCLNFLNSLKLGPASSMSYGVQLPRHIVLVKPQIGENSIKVFELSEHDIYGERRYLMPCVFFIEDDKVVSCSMNLEEF